MLIKIAGFLITLCGVGHTVGSCVQVLPLYGEQWLRFALWAEPHAYLLKMTEVAAGFWYTAYSFGPMLLVVGLVVVWMGFREITPPVFIAWILIGWTVVGGVLSGPSPLVLLLVAAVLLLLAFARAPRGQAVPGGSPRIPRTARTVNSTS